MLRIFSQDSNSSSDESSDEDVEVKDEGQKKVDVDETLKESKKPVQKVDKHERDKCQICSGTERCNVQKKPEIFVSCSSCKGNGKFFNPFTLEREILSTLDI